MPPKAADKEYLIILVNLGSTDETENDNDISFLEKSKLAMRHLIQRKIFLRPRDEVGIIMIGASESKNELSCDNVVEMNPLRVSSWDLVESINKLKGTKESGNWVDGIHVVLDYISRECVEDAASRTVVLLTDFKEDSDVIEQYDADTIAADIKNANIKLLAIGTKSLVGDSQAKLNPSEKLFVEVSEMVYGLIMTFDDTLPKLMIYKDTPKKVMPWKVDMDLFDIEIPVAVYLKTTEDFKLPRLQFVTENTDQGLRAEPIPVERGRALVDKNKTVIDPDNVITGNMYGRKFIPFSAEDKAAQKYESGPKGFMIYGFSKRRHITMDCLAGKGSYIVVPIKDWASPFYSLVKAMDKSNKVAIVRRVYRKNVAPKIGVLFPKLDTPGEPWCLVYIELTFAEDRRIVKTKSLKSTMSKLSSAQTAAVDNLIDSMMLTEVKNDSQKEEDETFKIGTVPNVSRQHVYDVFAHRALNPDKPLPPMSDFLKKILEPPTSVQEKSKAALEQIKSLFPMQLVEKKKKDKKRGDERSSGVEEEFVGTQTTTVDENAVREEDLDVQNFPGDEGEEDELCHITDNASQAMDIDVDELAKNM